MSGKKKRLRETAVEDVGSSQECEGNTRNYNDLLDLLQMIQNEQKAVGTAPRKVDKVLESSKEVVTFDTTVVQCAQSSLQKKKWKKNKSKKKATVESDNTSTSTNSASQKQVQKNQVIIVSSDSGEQVNGDDMQTSSNTDCTNPTLQPKKKRKKRKSKISKDKANQELNTSLSNNISNGQVVEENVMNISVHSVGDPLLATSEMIDLTTEDSSLEDPSSFEPYSNDEVSMAQHSMKWEVDQGPLKRFLQRLKVKNTVANFVPRTSTMENEYAGLEDNFPMPASS